MSNTGLLKVGRSDAGVRGGYIFTQYCGGTGGGGCIDPLGVTSAVIEYKIPRFVVYNRRILFENKELLGVRIFDDGGANILCTHSLGVEKDFYMCLSADGLLSDVEVQAKGILLSGVLPYSIEFLGKDIPQPKDTGWQGSIFAQIYWGNSSYLNEGGSIPNQLGLRIKKHDYDIQL